MIVIEANKCHNFPTSRKLFSLIELSKHVNTKVPSQPYTFWVVCKCNWLWKRNRANLKTFIQIMKLSNRTLFAQFENVPLGKYQHGVLFIAFAFWFCIKAFSTRAEKDFHVTACIHYTWSNAWICKSFLQCNKVITICQLRKHTKAMSRNIWMLSMWSTFDECSKNCVTSVKWIHPHITNEFGRDAKLYAARVEIRERLSISIVVSGGGGSVCVIPPNQCECAYSAIRGKRRTAHSRHSIVCAV